MTKAANSQYSVFTGHVFNLSPWYIGYMRFMTGIHADTGRHMIILLVSICLKLNYNTHFPTPIPTLRPAL